MSVESITVYVTASNAVRKTADDCRRITALYDALRIKYDKVLVDTKEMMTMVSELSGTKALPQTFVGDHFLGGYEAVFKMNEGGLLAVELRRVGYAGEVVGGESIPVARTEPQTVKKRTVVKKKVVKKRVNAAGEEEDDPDAPPPPPDEDDEDDAPPPPPDSDEDDNKAKNQDDDPPPPEDDDPPPPPDDD